MKITVKEYKNPEEFCQDENWQLYDEIQIIHYENGMVSASLLTKCKRWQTAVSRFFRALEGDRRFNGCKEYIIRKITENTVDEEKLCCHDVTDCFLWGVEEFDNDYYYVDLNLF